MHPAETAQERGHLRQALIAAQQSLDASSDPEARLLISKRIVNLAQRYRLAGGELGDLPGHAGQQWVGKVQRVSTTPLVRRART